MKGKKIGCCMTGSFCTFDRAFDAYRALSAEGAQLAVPPGRAARIAPAARIDFGRETAEFRK